MELIFLIFLFLTVYSYLIYPPVLFSFSVIKKNLWDRKKIYPTVSIIISAYNEEAVIKEKIQNSLALDYPKDLLEIIVSSDGSTDQTDKIVSEIKDSRIVLRSFSRLGKTACLNKVVPNAKGDIILFTDANSMFPADLLLKIASNFNDLTIGLVTGWTKYRSREESVETTGIYSKLEQKTKYWESMVSSCVGADGAVFAMKKSLYQPLKDNDINDFIIPLNVIRQGKRVVLDPEVFCFEEPSQGDKKAHSRQIRISTRTFGAIRRNLDFVNMAKFGSFAFFFLSHKVIRLLVPVFFIGSLSLNCLILDKSFFYVITLAAQIIFLGTGVLSLCGLLKGRFAMICKFFLITLSAQLTGLLRTIIGIEDTIWTPHR